MHTVHHPIQMFINRLRNMPGVGVGQRNECISTLAYTWPFLSTPSELVLRNAPGYISDISGKLKVT